MSIAGTGRSHISDLLNLYLEFYRSALKESSEKTYRYALAGVIKFFDGVPIERITVEEIARLMTHLTKTEHRAGKTIKFKLKLLKRLFRFAVDDGRIRVNPVQFERLPAIKQKLPNKVAFTYEQHLRVLNEAGDASTYHAFWIPGCRIAWHTGLRMSDVAGLKWEHLNFDDEIVTAYPKKKESVCEKLEIVMEPELRELLLTLRNQRTLPNNPYVLPQFNANYGARRTWMCSKFGTICGRAGLPAHTFHSYRHGFVTRLINAGVEAMIISSMTGQTIEQIQEYAHVSTNAKTEALRKSREVPPIQNEQAKEIAT